MGFSLKSIEFVPNFHTLLHTIMQCKGISICGKFANADAGAIKYYPVAPTLNPSSVVVAWQTGKQSDEVRNFIKMLPDE
jgi:hypothetical protein